MDEGEARVLARLGVREVGRRPDHGHGLGDRQAADDPAFMGAAVPKLVGDSAEFRLVVGQAGAVGGLGAGDGRPGLDQLADLLQDRERHVPAVGIERQEPIAHAGRRDDPAVFDRQPVQQGVGVDEVEAVAGRDVRQLPAEQGGDVGILAVVIEDVGDEPALLEHERAAGEVGRPGPGHLGPGLVPGEPLAEGPEPEAGDLVVDRLVDRGVDDEPVQAVGHHPVGRGFQGLGGDTPRRCGRRSATRPRPGSGRRCGRPKRIRGRRRRGDWLACPGRSSQVALMGISARRLTSMPSPMKARPPSCDSV